MAGTSAPPPGLSQRRSSAAARAADLDRAASPTPTPRPVACRSAARENSVNRATCKPFAASRRAYSRFSSANATIARGDEEVSWVPGSPPGPDPGSSSPSPPPPPDSSPSPPPHSRADENASAERASISTASKSAVTPPASPPNPLFAAAAADASTRNAHCRLGASAGAGAEACSNTATASNSSPGPTPPPTPKSRAPANRRGVGAASNPARAHAAGVTDRHRVLRPAVSSRHPPRPPHVASTSSCLDPSTRTLARSSCASNTVNTAAPVGPSTRPSGPTRRKPDTRSFIARRTRRSRSPAASSASLARRSAASSKPSPKPELEPAAAAFASASARTSCATRSRRAARFASHSRAARASAASPRVTTRPSARPVSCQHVGYTRSTCTSVLATGPPSGRRVRSGNASACRRAPSRASHRAGRTPFARSTRNASSAAAESGGVGSATPRSSAPCTRIFNPTKSRPRRSWSLNARSNRAATPYHPSLTSISAASFPPAPARRIADTTNTAGAPAGESRSSTRRRCGRDARSVSRSYRYNRRCNTAGAASAPAARLVGNARDTHAWCHTTHLCAFRTHSGARSRSTAPAASIRCRNDSALSDAPAPSPDGTRYPMAVSAVIARTTASTPREDAGRSCGLRPRKNTDKGSRDPSRDANKSCTDGAEDAGADSNPVARRFPRIDAAAGRAVPARRAAPGSMGEWKVRPVLPAGACAANGGLNPPASASAFAADAGDGDGRERDAAGAAAGRLSGGASSNKPRARANAAAETPTVAPFPVTNANAPEAPGVAPDEPGTPGGGGRLSRVVGGRLSRVVGGRLSRVVGGRLSRVVGAAVAVLGVALVVVPASSLDSPSIARARRIAASDTATGFPLPVANTPPAGGVRARA